MKKIYTLLALVILSASASAQVVISQVYGGGGNTGATYKNDFVELFNRGTVAVNLNGYTIQYASATGALGGTGALLGLAGGRGGALLGGTIGAATGAYVTSNYFRKKQINK